MGAPRPYPGTRFPTWVSSGSGFTGPTTFLSNGFPLGIIPSFNEPPNNKQLGSFALQSLLLRPFFGDWSVGFLFFNSILYLFVVEFLVFVLNFGCAFCVRGVSEKTSYELCNTNSFT
ncbi:hypothetical protein RND81_05G129000 [Saponaria officinalis]|uniref:Uncharacterized protein n=1 Tax=Saponaria officinalis TaxID=3572 RepID=A0AAW1KS14_SAPOF